MMTFAEIDDCFATYEASEVVISPVPYDGTSTWIKGADKGPEAIIASSVNIEWYDIETDYEAYKHGMHIASPVDQWTTVDEMVEQVYQQTRALVQDNKHVITLGGEHSVSIGAIRAYAEKYPNLSVLQLDAHADLRQEYKGSIYNHACVMKRVKDMGVPFVQVGIRSMDIEEKAHMDYAKTYFAHQIHNHQQWMQEAINQLASPVYITIDLDVFDPSVMSSTGTPEPGGLYWYNTIQFIKMVYEQKQVVGFDIVELCPNENNKAPDFLACKLLYKMLSYYYSIPH